MLRGIALFITLVACGPSVEWQAGDTIYLSTLSDDKLIAECRILANTGGGAHSFTYKTAVVGAYQKGKKAGGIKIIEDSNQHAVWVLKDKTFAAFNNKQDCMNYLRKK